MNFDKAYERFMEKHIEQSSGLRRERLIKGLGYGEMLFLEGWWEVFGNFDDLYPEFMVKDFQDGYRFLDFAYLRPPYWVDFEIDGYGIHYAKLDRKGFSDDRERQNMLILDDWKVFRFSVDKLREQQRAFQGQLLQIIGRLYGDGAKQILTPKEQNLILQAGIFGSEFTPGQAAVWLGMTERQARKYLHRLVEKNQMVAVSGKKRIRTYKLAYEEKIESFVKDERRERREGREIQMYSG